MKKQFIKNQLALYETESLKWSIKNRNPVVGSFDQHNNHKDYDEFLFKDCTIFDSCLDFGCGPGRNLVKYNNMFKKIDGVDIAVNNLKKATEWLSKNSCDKTKTTLYQCNGENLEDIPSDSYDIIMSTITLQHICVYEIRKNYLQEFYRVLKVGGVFTAQMGYGTEHPRLVNYYDSKYDIDYSKGGWDVKITDPNILKQDLEKVGFTNFHYYIRPVGPGDLHSKWIFFNVTK